jgi:hypothetical protein
MPKPSDSDLDEIRQNWKRRIVAECNQMSHAIRELQHLAIEIGDERFKTRINELHRLYCEMANSITLRLLLNGSDRSPEGCDEPGEMQS